MKFYTIEDARKNVDRIIPGDKVAFVHKDGRVRIGTIRFKKISAEEMGTVAAHSAVYIYAQYRDDKKVTDKYIGRRSYW